MSPTASKEITSLLVSIMSFFGWNVPDYINFLPKNIQSQIQIETSVPSTTQKKSPETKSEPERPKVKSEDKKQKKPEITLVKEPTEKPLFQYIPPQAPEVTKPPQTFEPAAPSPSTIPPPTSLPVTVSPLPLTIEEKVKRSTVNILCSIQKGNFIQKITGSGVVIDPQGVILTNAHVAEYVLLDEGLPEGSVSCFIRTGSPAKNSYKAKVVYISETWIQNNKNNLSMQTITGTGENGYALLVLTERVSLTAPDVPLIYLAPEASYPAVGQNIILAGYPAGFGDVRLLESALYELVEPSSITNVSSFDGNTIGVFNTSPTPLSQHGSSGGAMATDKGTLLGIIVATTIDTYSGKNNLQGISLPYIEKNIKASSGKELGYFIGNAIEEANNFETQKAQGLASILMQ